VVSDQHEGGVSGALNQNSANERCSNWVERRRQFLSNFGFPAQLRLFLHNSQWYRCGSRLSKRGNRIRLSIDANSHYWVPFLQAIECSPPIAGTRLTGNQRRHRKMKTVMLIS